METCWVGRDTRTVQVEVDPEPEIGRLTQIRPA